MSEPYEFVDVVIDSGTRVATVTLNRPQKLNAINDQMSAEIDSAFRGIKRNQDVSVVLLKAAGKSFCAGHDVNEIPHRDPFVESDPWFDEQKIVFDEIERYRDLMWSLPQPVIAQVHGHCYTVGVELAMQCDLVYACTDTKMAVRPSGGAARYLHMWPWLAGVRKTKELLFTGRLLSGEELVQFGIANDVFTPEDIDDKVRAVAEQIARVPLTFLALEKQGLNKCFDLMGVREAVEFSATLHAIGHRTPEGLAQTAGIYKSDDWREAVRVRDARYAQ